MLVADVTVDRREFAVRARLAVAPGERLALFGSSGAGKTTVLETIAGLTAPASAHIVLGGRVLTATARPAVAVPPFRRRIGLLRQDPGLFPHLPVRANLTYGTGRRSRAGYGSRAGRELAEVAGALGISGLLDAMPARLSGGQAHRVALGRVLLSFCDALLLDEPYAGLESGLRRELTGLITEFIDRRKLPAILVTHELVQAQALGDRLAVIDRGVVLQDGPPAAVVRAPATRRVAELVGYTSFVPAQAAGPGSVVAVHPDRVVPGASPDRGVVLTGPVTTCRPAGALWDVTIATAPDVEVTGRLREPEPVGSRLALTVIDPPVFGPDTTPSGAVASLAGQREERV